MTQGGLDLLDSALQATKEALRGQRLSYMALSNDALVLERAFGLPYGVALGKRVPLGEGVAGWVARMKKPLLVRDFEREVHFIDPRPGYQTGSFVSAPVFLQKRVIGVVNVADRADGRPFDESDLEALLTMVRHIVLCLAQQSAAIGYSERLGEVLVIIPAYNEEESIGYVVAAVKLSAPFADILVINDGSTDNTAAVARRFGASVLDLPHNLGIGGAIRSGFALAEELGYAYVARVDADGQHDSYDISRLLAPVREGKTDVAFGSRFCGGLNSYCPSPTRRLGIRIYGLVLSLIIGQRIHDATSGLWCVNRKVIRYFARAFPQDYPEVESHILLHKARFSQMEVPVSMHPRIGGRSSIGPMRSVYYAFKVLLAALVRALQKAPYCPEEETSAVENADFGHSDQLGDLDRHFGIGV